MKLLDLFAGIGGFSLAAHWMGWETVAFVEKEAFCQKVLRKNFGQDIEIHDDIFTFSGEPFRGRIDIVCGGFPCQPFSAAGRRQGVSDDRYLFPETLRVVREVQPAWIVLENVAGLLSMANESRDVKVGGYPYTRSEDIDRYEAVYTRTEIMLLNCIREEIEREGYAVQPVVIPASAIGAPHERKRIWIVANNPEYAGCSGRPSGDAAVPTRDRPDNGLPLASGGDAANPDNGERSGIEIGLRTAHASTRNDDSNAPDPEGESGGARLREDRPVKNGHKSRNGSRDVSDAQGVGLQGGIGSDGGERPQSPIEQLYGCSGKFDGWNADWPEVATEFCRMDDVVPDRVDRLKALGNSIVPQIAFEIFRAIEAAESNAECIVHNAESDI